MFKKSKRIIHVVIIAATALFLIPATVYGQKLKITIFNNVPSEDKVPKVYTFSGVDPKATVFGLKVALCEEFKGLKLNLLNIVVDSEISHNSSDNLADDLVINKVPFKKGYEYKLRAVQNASSCWNNAITVEYAKGKTINFPLGRWLTVKRIIIMLEVMLRQTVNPDAVISGLYAPRKKSLLVGEDLPLADEYVPQKPMRLKANKPYGAGEFCLLDYRMQVAGEEWLKDAFSYYCEAGILKRQINLSAPDPQLRKSMNENLFVLYLQSNKALKQAVNYQKYLTNQDAEFVSAFNHKLHLRLQAIGDLIKLKYGLKCKDRLKKSLKEPEESICRDSKAVYRIEATDDALVGHESDSLQSDKGITLPPLPGAVNYEKTEKKASTTVNKKDKKGHHA